MLRRPQRTLKKQVSYSGVGIHTGKEVTLHFCPAPPDSGILFQRLDLPQHPPLAAHVAHVADTSRSTTLAKGLYSIQTVEHVLAAVHAYQIDNLCIQVTAAEPPICDGSAEVFVQLIEEAGILEEESTRPVFELTQPIFFSQGSTHLVALPSKEYRISYTLHYPNTPVIRSQYFSVEVNSQNFKNEIATCRTFALYEEIKTLMDHGLIRGGSLENAVVIKEDAVFNKEGLRFADEMVRHKILDLIGDLSLVGFPFLAHIIAIRSGHATNVALAKELVKQFVSV